MTSRAGGRRGGGAEGESARGQPASGELAGLPAGCRSVVVVGLGVMGGSVAKAVRQRAPDLPVYGIDPDEEARDLAARDGVRPVGGLAECAMAGAVVVFAAPLDATLALVESESARWSRAALVTDVASLKAPVIAAARRGVAGSVFVGAHPMCGSEQSGYAASRADLFDGAVVWLCPATPETSAVEPSRPAGPECASPAVPERTSPVAAEPAGPAAQVALDRAAAFWRFLGGIPRRTSAKAHDRAMSWASHLPQLTAWALAGTLDDAGIGPSDLGPGGRDATRLAGSAPEMWGPLLRAAAKEDTVALAALEARLAALRRMLETGDEDALADAMSAGRRWGAGLG